MRKLTIVAILLVATALGLKWIAQTDTDLPPLNELVREGRAIYPPALRGDRAGASAWLHDPAPAARAWKLGWLALNGEWDARLLAVASLALQVLALGVLFSVLARCLNFRGLSVLALTAMAAIALTPAAPYPAASAAGSSMLVALSLLHLSLMAGSRERSRAWWLGLACGILNIAAASAGISSAVALVIWSLLSLRRDREAGRGRGALLAANAALAAVGLFWTAARVGRADTAASFFQSLQAMFAWPFGPAAWAAVVWAPGIFCIIRWMRRRSEHPDLALLSLLALGSLAQVVALAAVGGLAGDAAWEALLSGVLVNAACFAALPAADLGWPARNPVLVALWGIVVGNALLQPPPERTPVFAGPAIYEPVTAAMRRAAYDGDDRALRQSADLSEKDAGELLRLLRDPDIRRILPGSIRPPLAVEPENEAAGAAFPPDSAPPLFGRDDLPAFGRRPPAGATVRGEFVSKPLRTNFPILQIRICGELHPPDTSLVLRTASGAEIAPIGGVFEAATRWRRINFPAPRGPFRIVARDAGSTRWLAFTAPQEVGRFSWLAGKLASSWGWWLAGGFVCILGIAGIARIQPEPVRPAPSAAAPRSAWRVVPWLAFFAYGVFFASNLDTTAGPNDSGGYLNSAKLLVHGHLSAAPRMIFGPAGGETDIAPYLPITFHATKDGRMAPTYPVGLPLEVCAVAWLTSLAAAVPIVLLLQLLLGVYFTRQAAKAFGLPEGWAWLAGGIVGLSPVYLFQALQPLSDGPALVWVTAAIYLAWTSREKPWRAALAGMATALAVLLRPSDVLCIFPVLVCLAGAWPQLALCVLAGLPGAIWQIGYNHKLYGNGFITGYGDIRYGFALHFVPLTVKSYLRWLPAFFTPVIWLGFFGPFLRSIPFRARLVLATWVTVFMVFYAFYFCTYDNWYNMRFILPAAPAMVILGLFVLRRVLERFGLELFAGRSRWRSVVPSAVLVAILGEILVANSVDQRVLYWMRANRIHATGARWAGEHFPADAVVFAKHASGSLMYYTDLLVVRSDSAPARSPAFFERIERTGRPIYALTYHWEKRGFHWGAGRGDGYPDMPGRWERLAVLCDGEIYAWAWHPR